MVYRSVSFLGRLGSLYNLGSAASLYETLTVLQVISSVSGGFNSTIIWHIFGHHFSDSKFTLHTRTHVFQHKCAWLSAYPNFQIMCWRPLLVSQQSCYRRNINSDNGNANNMQSFFRDDISPHTSATGINATSYHDINNIAYHNVLTWTLHTAKLFGRFPNENKPFT